MAHYLYGVAQNETYRKIFLYTYGQLLQNTLQKKLIHNNTFE